MKPSDLIQQISKELLALGVRPGGALMVHSSLSALGHVAGGPETVVRGILQALGEEGTLLMPTLTFESVTPIWPIFDICRTGSDVGAITEYFRLRQGTRRSLHPTHSVCSLGPLTDALLGKHDLDYTPCGPHSPFHLLPKVEGQILMLGCGLRPNTSMHAIEETAEPPYLFGPPMAYRLQLADGRELEKVYRQHGFNGWVQRYDRVGDLMADPDLRQGAILEAGAYLLEVAALWEVATAALKQDPLFFIDKLD